MKRNSHTLRLAAVAAASALVLAACGSSDSGDDSDDDSAAAEGDGTFTVGSLLPQTGNLAFLGPPEFAGVDLAVKEINEAGGVLGKDAVHVRGDSGDTDSGIAPAESDKLIKAGSDVIVGAASSGVSLTVIEKIMSAGVVQFSPANTSTSFDEGDFAEPDLYFRTAPSDILQGAVLANVLVQDGRQNVAILARQDAYGEVLASEVAKNLEAAGSTPVVNELYSEKDGPSDAQISAVASANPDAIVLIAFDETKTIVPKLIQAGVAPADVPTYFVDGNTSNYGEDLPEGALEGVKGTLPGAEASQDFKDRLLAVDPELGDFSYAGESYDAVIVSALAAIAADNDAGEAIAEEIPGITKDGEKCTTFADCKALLEDGTDIDYDGVSGEIELSDLGSPTSASIGVYQYGADNTYKPLEYVKGAI